ncbi:hypothetical protein ASAP_0480 [Asaia bogorensis]|uniref:Uncharacterized protein n=1 Tax=Asaia bogorensis TaxID=91915 RepID=A0A060QC87_9PROT|nr:hypothetical protein ASAP_0480 [Asaia bogorensis]
MLVNKNLYFRAEIGCELSTPSQIASAADHAVQSCAAYEVEHL